MTDTLPVPDNYLMSVAWSLTGDPQLIEEMVQEGRIAVWEYARRNPGMPRAFYGKHAKFRMLSILGNRRFTGAEESKGRHHHDVTDLNPPSLDKEISDESGHPATLAYYAPGQDNTDGAELAYHHDEITRAIRKLPAHERRYVYDRFWRGRAAQELPRLWQSVRPKLLAELSHLEGSV